MIIIMIKTILEKNHVHGRDDQCNGEVAVRHTILAPWCDTVVKKNKGDERL